jgi:phage anti-repressor protein
MVSKFSKKELERIGCTEEEIELVMEYQRKLPFPNNDFEMSARVLHSNLGVGREFSAWITGRIKKYGFVEHTDYEIYYETSDSKSGDVDFTEFSKQQLSAMGIKKEYYITLTMAKELCTIENNAIGKLARKYFILMEKIVIDNKEWLAIRDPEKEEYKKMCSEVDQWCFRIWHHYASRSEYAVEADMLNCIVTGKTSQQLKSEYGVSSNDLIRDYLKKEHNEELLFLEQQNQVLLLMDMGFTERKNMLTKMHEVKFRNVERIIAA